VCPKRLRGLLQSGLTDPEVTRNTAVNNAKLRIPDLLDTDLNRSYTGWEGLDQTVVHLLVPLPLTEVVLERRDGKDNEKEQT